MSNTCSVRVRAHPTWFVIGVASALALAVAAGCAMATKERPPLVVDAALVCIILVALVADRCWDASPREGFAEAPVARKSNTPPVNSAKTILDVIELARKNAGITAIAKPTTASEPTKSAPMKGSTLPKKAGGAVDGVENLDALGNGMTVYVSCLSHASYKEGSGKIWRNIATESPVVSSQQCQADGSVRDRHFYFASTPAFSMREGFALGKNTLTGPQSHQLGISGDLSFSVVVLCRITGDVPSSPAATGRNPAVVFRLAGNTPNGNGAAFVLHNGSRKGNLIQCRASFLLGAMPQMLCKPDSNVGGDTSLIFDPEHRYMFVVSKDYGRIRIVMVDIDAREFRKITLLDVSVGAHDSVLFSNVDAVINPNGNWNANLLAFGIYTRTLSDTDVTRMYEHYSETMRLFDPQYRALLDALGEADSLRKKCQYDASTCKACSSVKDWTSTAAIIETGGTECLRQVHAFCSANPQHPMCSCWSTANPNYDTTCRAYRSVFSGAGVARPPDKVATATVRPPSVDNVVNNILSAENVDAVVRLLKASRKGGCRTCDDDDDEYCPGPGRLPPTPRPPPPPTHPTPPTHRKHLNPPPPKSDDESCQAPPKPPPRPRPQPKPNHMDSRVADRVHAHELKQHGHGKEHEHEHEHTHKHKHKHKHKHDQSDDDSGGGGFWSRLFSRKK